MPRLGVLLRGTTSPLGLASACLLGGAMGLMPWPQGAGLCGVLALAALAGNANLAVTLVVGLGVRLLFPALESATFSVGRWVLDGPVGAPFGAAINTPGLALLGLDTYCVAGGLFVGGALGLAAFAGLARAAGIFRRRLAGLAEGSELLRRFTTRPLSRLIAALILVEGPGAHWKAALRPVGMPTVVARAAAAATVFLAACLAVGWTGSPLARGLIVRAALWRIAPGSAVRSIVWEPGSDGFRCVGLSPARRRGAPYGVHAEEVRAEGVRLDRLRGRVSIARLVISRGDVRAAEGGAARPEPTLLPGEVPADRVWSDPTAWSPLASCLSDWVSVLGRTLPGAPGNPEPLGRRVSREAALSGPLSVEARHLLRGRARVSVGEIVAENVRLPNRITCSLRASNVSTHPWLQADPATLEAIGPRFELTMVFPPGEEGRMTVAADGLTTDAVLAALRTPPDPRPTGGVLSVRLAAPVVPDPQPRINAAPVVSFRGASLVIDGGAPIRAPDFAVRIGVNGPIAALAISMAPDELPHALANAGANGLAAEIRAARQEPEGGP